MLGNTAAETRFNNDKVKAAQGAVVGNDGAKLAFKKKSGKANPAPTAVSQMQLQAPPVVNDPTVVQQLAPPVGNVLQGAPAPTIDDVLDEINRNVQVEEFISSAPMQQAVTRTKLQNYFLRKNPAALELPVANRVMKNLDWLAP